MLLCGAPLSLCRLAGLPCLLKLSGKAWVLLLAPVPLMIAASGYLVWPLMTTRWCWPSWVGPQWSVYSLDHGSSGAFVGLARQVLVGEPEVLHLVPVPGHPYGRSLGHLVVERGQGLVVTPGCEVHSYQVGPEHHHAPHLC